jgi:uncharacterized protein
MPSMPHPNPLPTASTAEPSDRAAPPAAETQGEAAWRPDGQFRHVDPNYVPAEQIGGWIFTIVVSVIVLFVLLVVILAGGLWGWPLITTVLVGLALVVFLGWLTIKLPRWAYARLRYAVSETGVEIHRGIFWRSVTNVPRSRIQHTDVTQGPLARRYGIATLQMYTAGTENNEVDLEGLTYEVALQIRDFLVDTRGVSRAGGANGS